MSELFQKRGSEASSPSTSQGDAAMTQQPAASNQEAAVLSSAPVPSVRGEGPTCQALDHIVSITVGKDEKKETFQVHNGLLCFYSDYFRSASNGNFSEGTTKSLHLANVEVAVFRMFLGWLYLGKISDMQGNVGHLVQQATLIKAWIFADAYLVTLLKNEAIDALLETMCEKTQFPGYSLHYIYDTTPGNSPLRRLLIDYVNGTNVRCAMLFRNAEFKGQWPLDFLLELAVASYDGTRGSDKVGPLQFYKQRGCKYHDHASDSKTHDQAS